MPQPSQAGTQFKLRLPPSLRSQLKTQATRNNRSLTGEILTVLQQAVQVRGDARQVTRK